MNGVRNRAMLERIIKIMVSGQATVARRFLAGAGFWECRKAWRHPNPGRRRQRVGATLASYGGHSPKPRPLGGDFYSKVMGYHRLLARRFPYAVYYKMDTAGCAIVFRVLDCRQDP